MPLFLDYRTLKAEEYRVKIIVGESKLSYEEDTGSPKVNLLETKVLINLVISDAKRGAKFMKTDIKNYFLETLMDQVEYMKVLYNIFQMT